MSRKKLRKIKPESSLSPTTPTPYQPPTPTPAPAPEDVNEAPYLTFKDRKDILALHLQGVPKEFISKQFKVTKYMVTSVINTHKTTLTDMEKNFFALSTLKENRRIMELKEKHQSLVNKALDQGMKSANPVAYIKDMQPTMAQLDKEKRLNEETATENVHNTSNTTNLDVAKLLQTLKTPEEKKAFLLNRMSEQQKKNV